MAESGLWEGEAFGESRTFIVTKVIDGDMHERRYLVGCIDF
jgi:hypothetical protein